MQPSAPQILKVLQAHWDLQETLWFAVAVMQYVLATQKEGGECKREREEKKKVHLAVK